MGHNYGPPINLLQTIRSQLDEVRINCGLFVLFHSRDVANISGRLAHMPEPVGISVASLALLDPAIRAVRKAYGTHKLTKLIGEHYVGVQRKLDGEQARLDVALEEIGLACMPKSDVGNLANQCALWESEGRLPGMSGHDCDY